MQLRSPSWLRRSQTARLRHVNPHPLDRSTVVFAPHQDDETLGCGGTIILKRQAGTPVTIVFMTDGSTSHRRFMATPELRRVRRQEALDAAELLGVTSDHLHFLDFPDGQLSGSHAAAVSNVCELLGRLQPDEVFVPYRADGTADHEATYRVVAESIHHLGLEPRIYEYPVWLWNQWPWVPLKLELKRDTARTLWRTLRSGLGLRVFEGFETAVFVGDVLPKKRQALDQHRSQMTQLLPEVGWPILSDVSDGEFLKCFFQDFEIFRCTNPPVTVRKAESLKR